MYQKLVENEEKSEIYNVSTYLKYIDGLKEHVLYLEDELTSIFSDDYLNIILNKKGEELKKKLIISKTALVKGQPLKRRILRMYEKKHIRYEIDLDKVRNLLDEKETAILKKEKKLKKQTERRFILKFQKQIEDLNLSILRIKERLPNSVLKDENKKFFEIYNIGFLKKHQELYTKKVKEIAVDDTIKIGGIGFRDENIAEIDMEKYIKYNKKVLEKNLRNNNDGAIKEGILKIEVNGELYSFDMGNYYRKKEAGINRLLSLTKKKSKDFSVETVSHETKNYEVKVKIHNDVQRAYEIFKSNESLAEKNPAFLNSTLFGLAIKKQKELDRLANKY